MLGSIGKQSGRGISGVSNEVHNQTTRRFRATDTRQTDCRQRHGRIAVLPNVRLVPMAGMTM